MKIGIISWHVCTSYGGTEKFSVILANEMIYRGHDITVFYSTHKENENFAFMLKKLNSKVILKNIFLDISLFNEPGKLNKFSKELQKAAEIINKSNIDVLVFIVGWYTADLVFAGLSKYLTLPSVASVRNSPSKINSKYSMQEHVALILSSTNIQVLFPSYKNFYPQFLQDKIYDIPNTIKVENLIQKTFHHRKRILSLGRFDDSTKRFSILIKAFSILKKDFPDWALTICGDGPSMKNYQKLIASLNLHSHIFLPGPIPSPDPYFLYSDIFCIPSAFEGFPNVLLEAQAFSLPLVGFQDCLGVNEVIIPEYNGFLAEEPTASSLAVKLGKLMESESLRTEYGVNAFNSLAKYDFKETFDKWERMIYETQCCKSLHWNNDKSEEFFIKSLHASVTQYSMNSYKNIYQINKKLKKSSFN